jgi:hypothetical protein
MKIRAAKFVAAIVASILSSANALAAPETTEQTAETCLTSPRDYAPPGTRWRYRVERGTGRHCWFLKDGAEKAADKTAGQSAAAAEEPAPAPRKKAAAPRALSDARAEFSRTPVEPDAAPAPIQPAPASPVGTPPAIDGNQTSLGRDANMMAPAAAMRWPDPMSTANPGANPPPAAPEQSAEVRPQPAAVAAPSPKTMPRAVPPVPASEKPLSLPMLITIVAGGLSVTGMIVSMLFGWRASRSRLTPSAPMPPLEEDSSDRPRRPGDLYRERKRMRASSSGRRAA